MMQVGEENHSFKDIVSSVKNNIDYILNTEYFISGRIYHSIKA